jgi:hypothetical protein
VFEYDALLGITAETKIRVFAVLSVALPTIKPLTVISTVAAAFIVIASVIGLPVML